MSKELKDEALKAIRFYISELSPGIVSVKEQNKSFGTIVDIKPMNKNGCDISFCLGDHGTFDVGCGKWFNFENLPLSKDYVIDICDSIRKGQVKIKVWEWKGWTFRTEGVIDLSNRYLCDKNVGPKLGKVREIIIEPW